MRRPAAILLVGLLAFALYQRARRAPAHAAVQAVDERWLPIGMYAGQPPLPQQVSAVRYDDLFESMLGPPGIEQSGRETDASSTYYGTDTVPAPVYPTGRVNREIDLEMADLEVPWHQSGADLTL